MLVHLLPMKSRNKMVRDVMDTLATQSGLVYDVTDTDNGSIYVLIFATFKRRFITNRVEKPLWVFLGYFFFLFYLIDMARNAHQIRFPFT